MISYVDGELRGARNKGHLKMFGKTSLNIDGMKNFMTLSKSECKNVAKECFKNGDDKYKDALLLAEGGSYGSGISNLIICMEEYMKGLVLSLEANGFQFRSKVKGIKSLFENHSLRYYLAFAMSGFQIFSEEMKKLIRLVKKNPKVVYGFKERLEKDPSLGFEWCQMLFKNFESEIKFYSLLDKARQRGLYVDYKDKLISPKEFTPSEFEMFKKRVDNLMIFVKELTDAYNDADKDFPDHYQSLLKDFKDEYYEHFSQLIKKLNNKAIDNWGELMGDLKLLGEDISNELNDAF